MGRRVLLAMGASNVKGGAAQVSHLGDMLDLGDTVHDPDDGEYYGPTTGAALLLDADVTFRFSRSSTSLAVDWWPDAPGSKLNQALAYFASELQPEDELLGLVWIQASGDTHDADNAAQAGRRTGELFAHVRAIYPVLAVCVVVPGVGGVYAADVEAGQLAYIDSDPLTVGVLHFARMRMAGDGVHLRGDIDGMLALGIAAGAVMASLAT